MKRRFFIHFEITENCMKAGIRSSSQPGRDVFDVLAERMRQHPEVRRMLENIGPDEGQFDKVLVGVGRETEA
jgi:hypothetical protein